jgi:hypothetical protein
MARYLEATGRGVDLRELANISIHGWANGEGETIGVIVEKTFSSEHHSPVEKRFLRAEGNELLDYVGHCLGMDQNGEIGVYEVGADDEEESDGEPEGDGEPESEGY